MCALPARYLGNGATCARHIIGKVWATFHLLSASNGATAQPVFKCKLRPARLCISTYCAKQRYMPEDTAFEADHTSLAPPKVTAYSLVRFSYGTQALGSSEHRQLEQCKSECARRGWKFDESLCISDLGVSAFRGKNFTVKAALGRFLDAAKKGLLLPSPTLVVENPDRFSRAELDCADSTLWTLVKCGVNVLFLSNGLFLTKGDENEVTKRAILMFEFHRANQESKRKSELAKGSFRKKLSQAEQGHAVDLGVHMPSWVDFVGDSRQPGAFKFNDLAKVIRRVVDMTFDGRSTYEIARAFCGEGIPTPRARHWNRSLVCHILYSPLLVGTTKLCGKTLDHYYPAIVTDAEWERLQMALAQNSNRRGGPRSGFPVRNLFRNRSKCSECGGPVSTHQGRPLASGQINHCFECCNTREGRCKAGHYLRMDAIEMDFFGSYLKNYPAHVLASQDQVLQSRINSLRERIRVCDQQLADAAELIAQVPVKALADKMRKLNGEKLAAQVELEKQLKQNWQMNAAPTAWQDVLNTFKATNGNTIAELNAASEELQKELSDPDIRRRLRDLIPSVINGIVVDLKNEHYAVVDLSGKRGPWRDVSAYTAALREGWRHRTDSLGIAHRRNLQDGTFKAQVREPKTTGSVLQANSGAEAAK